MHICVVRCFSLRLFAFCPGKSADGFIIHHFPSTVQFWRFYILPNAFSPTHTLMKCHQMMLLKRKKQRKKLKFSVLLFVMVINTLTYVARKLKVMIMFVWRQKTSKMWLIVIFDANAGDKIHKNHMHIRYGMHTLWMVVVKTNEGIRLHPHYTHIAPHHKVNFHYEAIACMHTFSRISNEWSHLIKLYPAHFLRFLQIR